MPDAGGEQLFYKIGEVCERTGTQPYVLRFWESEFPMLRPRKNRAGQRIYTDEDVRLIEEIKRLLYEEEFTIAGARRRLEKGVKSRGGPSGEEEAEEGAPPRPSVRPSAPEPKPGRSATAQRGKPVPETEDSAEFESLRARVRDLTEERSLRAREAHVARTEAEELRRRLAAHESSEAEASRRELLRTLSAEAGSLVAELDDLLRTLKSGEID